VTSGLTTKAARTIGAAQNSAGRGLLIQYVIYVYAAKTELAEAECGNFSLTFLSEGGGTVDLHHIECVLKVLLNSDCRFISLF
jgi:hypothetical protein